MLPKFDSTLLTNQCLWVEAHMAENYSPRLCLGADVYLLYPLPGFHLPLSTATKTRKDLAYVQPDMYCTEMEAEACEKIQRVSVASSSWILPFGSVCLLPLDINPCTKKNTPWAKSVIVTGVG